MLCVHRKVVAGAMGVVRLADSAGETITLLDVDGDYFPPDLDAGVIQGLKTFNFRPDDVIVCSYPKTGKSCLYTDSLYSTFVLC